MKYVFALFALLLFCSFADFKEAGKGIRPVGYKVVSSKAAPGISKTKTNVQFTFRIRQDETVNPTFVADTVLYSHNGVQGKLAPDAKGVVSVLLPAGATKFQFYYTSAYYEIYTDTIRLNGGHHTCMDVTFDEARYEIMCDKPVIYVYPAATQQVSIRLDVQGQLGFTYPAYNDGWNFTADPDGTLHMNGKEYGYLFWDAKVPSTQFNDVRNSGFVVQRDSLVPFFEGQLTAMGLNAREQQDFITYWCPLMQKNEKSFVHFLFTAEYDSIATIGITPKPDHLFRVFMVWEDGAPYNAMDVQPQSIPGVTREGFTVIEWGGGEMNGSLLNVTAGNR